MDAILRTVRDYGRMVRFSHSIFALPFALASLAFAAIASPLSLAKVLWVIVAMVAARNAAMGFNRLADAEIDARNPRTAAREIPRGVLTRTEVALLVLVLSVLFVVAAGMLNRTCLILSPLALAIIFGYSYTKRFTSVSQLVLGFSLAMAPAGAWIAVTGSLAAPPLLLSLAVLCWVAGFDIIYALLDIEFDRREGLYSIPARLGAARSLWISRLLHLIAVGALAAVYPLLPLHPLYLAGVAAVGALLVYEQSLVRAEDLSKVGVAFFTTNGIVGVVYLLAAASSVALGR